MRHFSRRTLIKGLALSSVTGMGMASSTSVKNGKSMGPKDIRIDDLTFSYEDFLYRTPIKFGGAVVDRATLLNVECRVSDSKGRSARGFGSMPLGNVWSFPSKYLSYSDTLGAMKSLADRVCKVTRESKLVGHPVEILWSLNTSYLEAAKEVTRLQGLSEPIPDLCTLVTASPFDAAVHDAYGKLHELSSYRTYGSDFLPHDLSRYLEKEFKGEFLDRYILPAPKPRLPLYHLTGAVDPLVEADITHRVNDGLPETLSEWIQFNGLTHIKIKLNGSDLKWDIERVIGVDRVTTETQKKRGVQRWVYSLDFNEKCPNVGYLLDFLHRLKEQSSDGFDRIQYIEQPTARDLKKDRANVMHEAAKLRPIVIDESLTDLESLVLAREMGYTGAALKACKGQTHALLMAAAAQKFKMFLCVQDLTCPGASLIHSAGLAAHVPGVAAIEANARQYCPVANKPWESKFPGIFRITDGTVDTSVLDRPGLSAVGS
jgi:L-alanine-DL-glutamate epimerase-like enolase superfamily enzyme